MSLPVDAPPQAPAATSNLVVASAPVEPGEEVSPVADITTGAVH